MYALSLIKRMAKEERTLVHRGALFTFMGTGGFAYFHYREYLRKSFRRSEAHYKLGQMVTNCTPWKQMYFTWWRMPEEEWTVYHRFRPYFVIGQLDYSKEVLIPRTKTVGGQPVAGFDVINPFYCYEGGKISMRVGIEDSGDPIKIDRAALIVRRGWIPASYRERQSRPKEQNSRELVKLTGCFMPGKDVHNYKVPNNPDAGEWNNLCLEDIGIYWDLPNFDESKYYYFHCVNVEGTSEEAKKITPVRADTPDGLIEEYYGWRWNENMHKQLFIPFGAAAAATFAIAAASVV